jgi:hypothetical protein
VAEDESQRAMPERRGRGASVGPRCRTVRRTVGIWAMPLKSRPGVRFSDQTKAASAALRCRGAVAPGYEHRHVPFPHQGIQLRPRVHLLDLPVGENGGEDARFVRPLDLDSASGHNVTQRMGFDFGANGPKGPNQSHRGSTRGAVTADPPEAKGPVPCPGAGPRRVGGFSRMTHPRVKAQVVKLRRVTEIPVGSSPPDEPEYELPLGYRIIRRIGQGVRVVIKAFFIWGTP